MGRPAKNLAVTSSRSPADKDGDPCPGAVPHDVLDEVFGPGQRARTGTPTPRLPSRTAPGRARVRRPCAAALSRRVISSDDPLQHPHGPAEFVQPHDCADPGSRDRGAERHRRRRVVQVRFRPAAQELIDDECQGGVAAAGVARDQAQMPVRGGTPAELRDALLFGKVHQPQPDPCRGSRPAGNGSSAGEGLCDGTARRAAAGRLPQGGYRRPSAGPPVPGQIAGRSLPAEPGELGPAGRAVEEFHRLHHGGPAGHLPGRAK